MESLAELGPDDVDLVICGSRGYGPARRVLLGGVSSRLIRTPGCRSLSYRGLLPRTRSSYLLAALFRSRLTKSKNLDCIGHDLFRCAGDIDHDSVFVAFQRLECGEL